ncbi:helix-turn-helix transcriptional regulator [Nocardia mexicana]|uniref:DNA-binding XRE family transcriptional regulator n=1 Tax=Nocardia mexicana TaxID=279262 RepID=A0A370GII2_9NOCA|nr:helix-turn-helix transcriptional regulator [Nocardia mexicana]RDI43471.1 DNA-binding XRE family transcriptional regulator [Nocardia mexicana]
MYNLLREIRTAQGVSRAELAEAVEVNVQTIGALERGQYSPSLYLALMICEALDTQLDQVFGLAD